MTIGAYLGHYLAKVFAVGHMASSASGFENLLAVLSQRFVHREWISGRRQLKQKISVALETLWYHSVGARPDSHRRRVVALLDFVVIAVPMQPKMLPRFLVPDLRQIGRADAVVVRQLIDNELGRIESVYATASFGGP